MPVASLLPHRSVPPDQPCKPPPGARSEFNNWGTPPPLGSRAEGGALAEALPGLGCQLASWKPGSGWRPPWRGWRWSQPALWGPVTDSPFSQIGMNGRRLEAREKPNGSQRSLNPTRPGRVTLDGVQLRVLKKDAAVASFGHPGVSLKPFHC